MQEIWVESLDWENNLEKEMATHSSIPAWKTLWTEEPGGLEATGLQSRTQLSDWGQAYRGTSGTRRSHQALMDTHQLIIPCLAAELQR